MSRLFVSVHIFNCVHSIPLYILNLFGSRVFDSLPPHPLSPLPKMSLCCKVISSFVIFAVLDYEFCGQLRSLYICRILKGVVNCKVFFTLILDVFLYSFASKLATKFHPNETTPAKLWRHIDFSRWWSWGRKSLHLCKNVQIHLHTKFWWKISQSTAELLLLAVCENGRLPYWNCSPGFDFDRFVVVGMSFCFGVPNLIKDGPRTAELRRHIDF